jgi:glycosyltransferase involved in cell wall biosynthesis
MVEARITVLMPVYNAERFLREAMDSILNQSFHYFEFLIIDDGSTDNSVAIVQSYDDSRITFVRNERNLGISETLNRGIALAKSDLIARMDADDISNPYRLQKQYNYMATHPKCALLSTWARVLTEDKKYVRLEKYRSLYYYYNLTFECWIYHPTVMFRRKAVCDVGMYSMPYSEDYDLFWKVSTKYQIGNLSEPLVNYRLSPTSLNTVLKKEQYDIANEQNVLRNIRYYMGEDFQISKPCLECLRHNFEPIIQGNNIKEALESLEILDAITEKILQKDNPNRDEKVLREARYYKRKFIITELSKAFPMLKALLFLSRTREWLILYTLSTGYIRWQLRKVKSFLFSF